MSPYTTIDEKLEAFRRKCSFRVYLPKKQNRYGIKIYALVDVKMKETANLGGSFKVDNYNLASVPRLWIYPGFEKEWHIR